MSNNTTVNNNTASKILYIEEILHGRDADHNSCGRESIMTVY